MKGIALFLCLNLLVASILPNQDMHELSEIINLVDHYHDHVENAGHDVGILDFLSLHYADDIHGKSAGHEKLPFHHAHPDTLANFFLGLLPTIALEVPNYNMVVKPKFIFQQRFVSQFFHSIWQPPKL